MPLSAYGADWYDSNWLKTRAIETDPADFDSNLTDYPLYINVTSIDLGVDTQADCDDVILVNYYNTTLMEYELENCDTTNDILEMWVKLPTAYSANATRINMYYDNGAATDQQQGTSVWRSEFQQVLHLNGTFTDSTSNAETVTNSGTSAVTNEYIGDSRSFDGVDDYLANTNTHAGLDGIYAGGGSFSLWLNPNSDGEGSTGRIYNWENSDGTGGALLLTLSQVGSDMEIRFNVVRDTTNGIWDTTSREIQTNQWNHYVVTYNEDSTSNNPVMYVDGVSVGVTEVSTPSGAVIGYDTGFCYGNLVDINTDCHTTRTFDGDMDELRFYDGTLSADWVNSDWECQRYDGSCITVGDEQTEPSGDTVTVSDEIALEDAGATGSLSSQTVTVSDEMALEDTIGSISGSDTVIVSDEIALEDGGATAGTNAVFVSDEIALEDGGATGEAPTITFNAIVLSLNSPTETRLGGVFNATCAAGEYMYGIGSDGNILCRALPP